MFRCTDMNITYISAEKGALDLSPPNALTMLPLLASGIRSIRYLPQD